jgi:dTMP kinase
MQGFFISFEGCDGVGKTTQAQLLGKKLEKLGRKITLTHEPGGTEGAEEIRKILLGSNKWRQITELLLYSASRYEHLQGLIIPSLMEGNIVICDRYIDSTIAYQGYGQGVDMLIIEAINKILFKATQPDITFILDMEPEKCAARIKVRQVDNNRYDQMNLGFYQRVRKGFLEISCQKRCHLIKADDDAQAVHAQIISILSSHTQLKIAQ